MTIRTRLSLAASILLTASEAVAQARLEAGEWESKISTEVPGMEGGPRGRIAHSCYTSADTKIYADRDAWVADMMGATANPTCKPKNAKLEGTTLSMTLECADLGRVVLRHDFRGTTGTMDAETWQGDELNSKAHIEMRRVADECSAETIEVWKQLHPGQEFKP